MFLNICALHLYSFFPLGGPTRPLWSSSTSGCRGSFPWPVPPPAAPTAPPAHADAPARVVLLRFATVKYRRSAPPCTSFPTCPTQPLKSPESNWGANEDGLFQRTEFVKLLAKEIVQPHLTVPFLRSPRLANRFCHA